MEWQPIETSPMDRLILIREKKGYRPDLVRWQMKEPERRIDRNLHLSRPAGWFRPSGERSHIANPTEWLDIPK